MDKYFRRALYTALVAGGLMVVGASSAHAAAGGLLDPVAQGATDVVEDDAAEDDAAARGDLDAPAGELAPARSLKSAEPGTDEGVGAKGLVGDLVGREGIVRSLLRADVAGVVEGTLGKDGLVDGLLTGGRADWPEEPGTGEPGTEEPGTDPGVGGPGAGGPGAGGPGAEEPGTGKPGTDGPGTGKPGMGKPGTGKPGTEEPGTDGGHEGGPGVDKPGADKPGVDKPGADKPGAGGTDDREPDVEDHTDEVSGGFTVSGAVAAGLVIGIADVVPTAAHGHENTPSAGPDADRDVPGVGVDLSWGDKGGSVPTAYDGISLSEGLSEGLRATPPEPEAEAETAPVVVPEAGLAETGHMITGQLSLISLLLGLGIAALRTRRR